MKAKDLVRINAPENERLHGTLATVLVVEEWGAHLHAPAAETQRFRAHWSEMEPVDKTTLAQKNGGHYTGNSCSQCGSFDLMRSGTCETCLNCGHGNGCA